jgi:HAMP domain-containing protein
MTHTANHAVPEPGKFRRAVAAVWAFLQAMESTSFDYTLDRIERLEREVGRLKEELRQKGNPEAGDAHIASAAAPEH